MTDSESTASGIAMNVVREDNGKARKKQPRFRERYLTTKFYHSLGLWAFAAAVAVVPFVLDLLDLVDAKKDEQCQPAWVDLLFGNIEFLYIGATLTTLTLTDIFLLHKGRIIVLYTLWLNLLYLVFVVLVYGHYSAPRATSLAPNIILMFLIAGAIFNIVSYFVGCEEEE